jgi:Zn-dependent M28 family amino/carboxypeptidase
LRDYGYSVSTQSFAITNGKTSINVVAEKAGTTSDTIVLGAHIDSKPPSPGGNDNASGVAVMLELARVLAVSDAAPTIRFVAFGAEEISGPTSDDHHFGSRHYVAGLSSNEKARTEGMVSIDMVGYGGTFNVRNMGYSKMTVVDSLKAWGKYTQEPLAYLSDPGWSDHDSFEYAGIPAAWIEWRNDPDYHTVRDTAAHVQYDRVERSGRLMRGWVLDLTTAEVDGLK